MSFPICILNDILEKFSVANVVVSLPDGKRVELVSPLEADMPARRKVGEVSVTFRQPGRHPLVITVMGAM